MGGKTDSHSLSVLLLASVSLLLSACGTLEVGIEHTASPTAEAVPTPTPTQATATLPIATPTATAAFQVSPLDLCHEYLELTVSFEEAEEQAVVTSYLCHNACIDSTGQSPSKSPALVIHRGMPIHLRLTAEQPPVAVDVRLYPGAGVSASFLRWPEELPAHMELVDRFQPEPGVSFQYLPQVSPGEYSLVVKATWEGDVDVFYAISFILEETAK